MTRILSRRLLFTDQCLALAQSIRHRPERERDAEQYDAQHSRSGVVGRGSAVRQRNEYLLHEDAKRRHCRNQERVAVVRQHCERRNGQNEQNSQAAGDAATGIEDECDGSRIHAGVHECHNSQACPFEASRDDQEYARSEVGDAGGHEH
jgi:hypothetical protein